MAVTEGESTSIIFWLGEAGGLEVSQSDYLNRIEMPGAGKPYVKVLWSGLDSSVEHYDLVLKRENNPDNSEKWDIIDLGNQTTVGDTKPEEVRKPTDFVVFLNEEKLGDVTFKQGANYNLLLVGDGGKPELVVHQVSLFGCVVTRLIHSKSEIRSEVLLTPALVCQKDTARGKKCPGRLP